MKLLKQILTIFTVIILFCPCAMAKKKEPKPDDKGYVGKLPEISKFFQYKIKEKLSPAEPDIIIEDIDEKKLKKAPMDDALFLDVIIKKQQPSKYVDDLLTILPVVENFRTTLSKGTTVQKFNANVNSLDLYVTKLGKDYSEKPESITESYSMLQEINYRAKLLGNLKYEANIYSRYKPVLEHEYTPEYLKEQDDILLKELDKTIFILKNECDKAQFGN